MIRQRRLCLVTTMALALAGCGADPPDVPPDILLVTVDTLRADALHCYGGEADVGEAICSLADPGVRFRWAFSAAPYTAPSTASILTGLYPHAHGARQRAGSSLREDLVTLPELLREAGYATAAIVSNPVLGLPGFEQGFDHYDDEITESERNRSVRERRAEATTAAALRWLDERPDGPWLLWVHYQDPHGPYDPPGTELPRDDPAHPRLDVLEKDHGLRGIPRYQALPGLFTRQAYAQLYSEEIRYLDRHLETLLEAVAAGTRPTDRRPAILLTADHGEAFGEDGFYFAHGHSVALDQIRVPLLYRASDARGSRVEDTPVSLVDVAPMILGLAGIDAPPAFAGRDPLAGLRDAALPFYAESGSEIAVIRGRRYQSLARRRPGSGGANARMRLARLGGDDALPGYRATEDDDESAALRALLDDYLARTRRSRPTPDAREVPAQRRSQLRALGYAE